jgi:glycosyltransferase involved in cell wall biosynthesis
MIPVTAIIPTYNEEDCLLQALKSVAFADEVLVVDSFSTDRTLEIAKSFGAKIIQREFEYPASQKNWASPQAKHPWILLLDADEIVSEPLKHEVQSFLQKDNPKKSGFWIYRDNFFMGRKVMYSGWQGDKVIRLFKRDSCRYEDKFVHEEIVSTGEIGFLKEKLIHNTYKSFDHYLSKIERYAEWQSKDYDKKIKKLTPFHFIIKPAFRFIKHYWFQRGFLDGFVGLIIAALQSYGVLLRYVYLLRIKLESNENRT